MELEAKITKKPIINVKYTPGKNTWTGTFNTPTQRNTIAAKELK